jgi:hypothetical protein
MYGGFVSAISERGMTVSITHLCASEQLKVGLCDHLREERVE